MFLWSAQQYQEADVILPDGGRIHYVRITPGNFFTDAVFSHQETATTAATPTAFYKSTMRWNGNGWDLTLLDGTGGAIVAAVVVVALAIIVSRGERWAPVVLGVVIAILIAASGWRLESVPSSPRKDFYLAAIHVKTGMTENEARSIMATYRLFVVAEGEESFRFRSSVDTEDALIIHYDPATKKIISTELDLD